VTRVALRLVAVDFRRLAPARRWLHSVQGGSLATINLLLIVDVIIVAAAAVVAVVVVNRGSARRCSRMCFLVLWVRLTLVVARLQRGLFDVITAAARPVITQGGGDGSTLYFRESIPLAGGCSSSLIRRRIAFLDGATARPRQALGDHGVSTRGLELPWDSSNSWSTSDCRDEHHSRCSARVGARRRIVLWRGVVIVMPSKPALHRNLEGWLTMSTGCVSLVSSVTDVTSLRKSQPRGSFAPADLK
jgi:hypothetical protein